jgi:uncharacterized damage-inducible protein DinB
MTEIGRIKQMIGDVYANTAWHGPTLLSTLGQVTGENMEARVGSGHSILELIGHMTAWRKFVIALVKGDSKYDVSDEMNFPAASSLAVALQSLEQSQNELLAALDAFDENKLQAIVPARKYDFYTLIHGCIQHDLYHQGQIVMILRSIA